MRQSCSHNRNHTNTLWTFTTSVDKLTFPQESLCWLLPSSRAFWVIRALVGGRYTLPCRNSASRGPMQCMQTERKAVLFTKNSSIDGKMQIPISRFCCEQKLNIRISPPAQL